MCAYFSPDSDKTTSLEKTILRIEDSYISQKQQLKMSWWICYLQTCSFSFHKTLINGLESCELFVDYCDVCISCLDYHSDGTHSLQRIHWWASDVMLNFSKSVLMKNKFIYILHGLRVSTFSANFHFWLTIPLKPEIKKIVTFSVIFITWKSL